MNSDRRPWLWTSIVLAGCLAMQMVLVSAAHAQGWKTVDQMSDDFKTLYDPSVNTPRDGQFPYMPAERFPFKAPFTTEEIAYRASEFAHVSRWPGTITDVFGVITSSGYINQGETIFYITQDTGVGYAAYLYESVPGKVYSRWMTYDTFPPENEGLQQLWIPYRTDKEFRTKMDYFIYSPQLRRVRRQPEPRRDQRFPDNAQTFDDVMGRDPWEFEWELLGTDVLYETVRYPSTRATIMINTGEGNFVETNTASIKPMGDDFPRYTADGGVQCWVLKATAKPDWLPGYGEKYLIYWFEKGSFFPLRQEKYDENDKLIGIEVRSAELQRPDLGEHGYSSWQSVYWYIPNDLLSYSVHNPHRHHDWTQEEKDTIFNAEFMRRDWLVEPMKSQVLIDAPENFFLRPNVFPGKFPSVRNTALPPEVDVRYQAQEAAGKLVFETGTQ